MTVTVCRDRAAQTSAASSPYSWSTQSSSASPAPDDRGSCHTSEISSRVSNSAKLVGGFFDAGLVIDPGVIAPVEGQEGLVLPVDRQGQRVQRLAMRHEQPRFPRARKVVSVFSPITTSPSSRAPSSCSRDMTSPVRNSSVQPLQRASKPSFMAGARAPFGPEIIGRNDGQCLGLGGCCQAKECRREKGGDFMSQSPFLHDRRR